MSLSIMILGPEYIIAAIRCLTTLGPMTLTVCDAHSATGDPSPCSLLQHHFHPPSCLYTLSSPVATRGLGVSLVTRKSSRLFLVAHHSGELLPFSYHPSPYRAAPPGANRCNPSHTQLWGPWHIAGHINQPGAAHSRTTAQGSTVTAQHNAQVNCKMPFRMSLTRRVWPSSAPDT